VTTIEGAFPETDQVKLFAPLALSRTEFPVQTVPGPAMVKTGFGYTFTAIVAEFVQPFTLLPVKVYTWLELGVNATPELTPFDQIKLLPPKPVNITELPSQINVLEALMPMLGKGVTAMDLLALPTHPFKAVPETV
jgi:hypothetical protein